jgi:hypothetical protein
MRKSIYFLVFLLALTGPYTLAQDLQLRREKSIDIDPAQDFGVDRFGNAYLLQGEEIVKIDGDGEVLYRFSDPSFDSITYVDPFLSMDLLLYYGDFFTVQVLDNRLNPIISPIRLDDYGFYDVQWVKTTDQHSLWFYDQSTDKLIKWSVPDQKPAIESLNLSQAIGREVTPSYLLQTINHVYINNSGEELLQFDLFGNFIRALPISTPDEFQVMNYKVYYLTGQELVIYDPKLRQEKRVALPHLGPWSKYQITEEYVYLLGQNQLHYLKIGR